MRGWVIFHYDMICDKVSGLEFYKTKEEALKHFNIECKRWFEVNTKFKADNLPASYGYPMRKFYGMSTIAFKKMFGIGVEEVMGNGERCEK